jgi:DNA-binding response OmpR family regulator
MVRPSCPALLIHDDDEFRKKLIATLDQQNFSVTFAADGGSAIDHLKARRFSVVLLGVNLATKRGIESLDFLREQRQAVKCGLIILGDPDPEIRKLAAWADETLLKPVDPQYVATRARAYCDCD